MDITLPETKPATEWVNGRALQKMSPRERHSRAQSAFDVALRTWAEKTGSGRVGPEWEFRLAPPREVRRPLVPDVAYLSYDRVGYDDDEAAQLPRVAPNAVVEVLSPGDRKRDVNEKIRVYLAAGTDVVFVVDTVRKTVTAHSNDEVTTHAQSDVVAHSALPGFTLPVERIFAKPRPRRSG